jgi:hypothetical protein
MAVEVHPRADLQRPAGAPRSGGRAALVAAALVFAAWCFTFRGVAIDDAYIYHRFARHLHAGMGLRWNAGQPPVEGVSSLLWTLLLAPFAGSRDAIYPAAKLLGLALALGAIGLAARTAAKCGGAGAGRRTAILLLASPVLALHALSGMETALAALLLSGLCMCVVHLALPETAGRSARRWGCGFGATWWLATLARPEFVLFGAAAAAILAAQLDTVRRRAALPGLLGVALVLGVLTLAARFAIFGHAFPLPFYAKQGGGATAMGIGYVALAFAGLLGGGLVVILRGLRRAVRPPWREPWVAILLPALACMLGFIFFHPSMGFVYRFAVPFWVTVVIAASACMSRGAEPARSPALALLLVYHATAAVPAWHVAHVLSQGERTTHVAFGKALGDLPNPGTLLALYDVGAPAFFSDWETYEGAGLVTPEVTLENRRAAWLIRTHRPDVIFLAECRTERLGEAANGEYVQVARLPWLVFADGSLSEYQCVWCRADYVHRDALTARLHGIGFVPRPPPWYFSAYRKLKAVVRL